MVSTLRVWSIVSILVVAGACGSSSDESPSAATATSSTVAVATTSEPEVAPTSASTPATSLPAPASTATTVPPPVGADDSLLVVVSGDGAELTVSRHRLDGALVDTRPLTAEARFFYLPSTAGGRVILNSNYEDYWFSCAGYNGTVVELAADGGVADVVEGGWADLDGDGSHVVHLTGSTCGTDALDPNWVHAPADTVVWRDLASGDERSWTFPGAVLDSQVDDPVGSLAVAGDRIVAVVDQSVVFIDPGDPALPAGEDAVPLDLGPEPVESFGLVGVRSDGAVVGTVFDVDTGMTRIIEVDPATGAEIAQLAEIEQGRPIVAVTPDGGHLAVVHDGELTIDGSPVTLEGVDLTEVRSIGW